MGWTALQPIRSKECENYYLYDNYAEKRYLNEGKSLNSNFKESLEQGANFSKTPFNDHYRYLVKERKAANKVKIAKNHEDSRLPLLPIKALSHIVDKDIHGKELKEDEEKLITTLMNLQWFKEIRDAAKSFYEIIKGSNVAKLTLWLECYQNTGITKLKTFIMGIRLDLTVVGLLLITRL